MKYLIGILVIIIVSIALIIGVVSQLDSLPSLENTYVLKEQLIESDGYTWYQPATNTMNVIVLKDKDLEVVFTEENAQSLKEQARSERFEVVLNGGYFLGTNLDADPIGLLQIRGEVLSNRVQDSQNQVTQIIVFDHEEKSLSIFPWNEFDDEQYMQEKYSIIQAGPLVMKDGQLQETAIAESINGSDPYLRTLIGYTNEGEMLLLVTRISYSLPDLVKELQRYPITENKQLTLVNLDGGSSTAMHVPDLLQFSFGENKRLPYVIGIPK